MKVTGAILAAGMSSRMGRNKLLLPFRRSTIIGETVRHLAASQVDNLLVVTGHESESVRQATEAVDVERLSFVNNPDYRSGRAESIKCAVKSVGSDTDGILFMLGDKPGVSTSLIDRALDHFTRVRPPLLYIKTPFGRGHPIIFARALFNELVELSGDMIGQALIEKYQQDSVELFDDDDQIDVDNHKNYLRLLSLSATENETR